MSPDSQLNRAVFSSLVSIGIPRNAIGVLKGKGDWSVYSLASLLQGWDQGGVNNVLRYSLQSRKKGPSAKFVAEAKQLLNHLENTVREQLDAKGTV